jgi:hypothetical protein
MAFNDLLSTSFLFSIAIIIILIGGIFAYVSYRMSEQDHKITSMLGLVSTMAEELQFFRSKLSSQNQSGGQAIPIDVPCSVPCPEERHVISMLDPNNLVTGIVEPTSLISVSDEESDSNDESVDESDSDSESDESESNGDEDSGSESDEDQNEEYNLDEIVDLEGPVSLIQNIDECDLNDLEQTLDQNLNTNNIKSIHLAEPIDLHDSNQDHDVELLASDLKTISISDLEDTNKKPEYKKMSLNKLREVVLEKGVVSDASKLKKNDLLKLLGDE